jgi:hypothetical protein
MIRNGHERAVSGLKLKDLCDKSNDMQAIREAFGLTDPMSEGGNEICGQDGWTVAELTAWALDGEDGRKEERCRRLVDVLGLPLPDECPSLETRPPLPAPLAEGPSPDKPTARPNRAEMNLEASEPTDQPSLPPRISTD